MRSHTFGKNVIMLLCLLIFSCRTTSNNLKENNIGIYEKIFLEINGTRQGMFIKGNNLNNPVLLFLHGGPGMPSYGLTQKYPTLLEENFTVCWWEQRGAGLSYSNTIKAEELIVDNFISDIAILSDYLCKRFGKEKIFLMGHSWGSYLGLLAVKEKPELFHAYIGVGQITNQYESEKISYKYMLEQYHLEGNKKMVRKLEKHNILESNSNFTEYEKIRDTALDDLGLGMMRNVRSGFSGIYIPIMKNKEYTFKERNNIWKGKKFYSGKTNLNNTIINTNLFEEIKSVSIPVYFFHGVYDYAVSHELAKDFHKCLEAPLKGFYSFHNSAHSPIFEEPELVRKILIEDVIKVKNNM